MTRRVVARGSVAVDPAKAVEKMRAYQLVDPRQWALEVVRIAAAGGATRIDVRQDADDVEIAFDGDPLPPAELARLFDHLFRTDDRRARLLAIAVNTVLGLGPRWLDVYTREGGTTHRVRWTPELVDRALASGAPLASEPIEAMPGTRLALPQRGMLVHLRDRFGLEVLADFVRDRQPEVELLAGEARRLGARLHVDGAPLAAEALAPPERTVSLDLGPGLRGELAFVPDADAARLEIAEQGVVLDRIVLPCAPSRVPNATWPFAGWIDGEVLPTNISRSQCDLSGELGDVLRRAIARAGSELVERALARRTEASDEALLRIAVAALGEDLAAYAAGQRSVLADDVPLPVSRETLDRILAEPLLPRATTGALSVADLARAASAGARPLWWTGDRLEEDLAELLPRVMISRPGAVDWILSHLDAADAAGAVTQARAASVRRQEWRRHAPRPPAAWPLAHEVLRARFGKPGADAPHGEIALAGLSSGEARVSVTGWLEGRPLGTEQLGSSPLPLAMALAGPGLVANPRFDGLEHDAAFEAAMRAGFAAAAGAVRVACGETGIADLEVQGTAALGTLDDEARASLIRGAIQIQLAALERVPEDLESRLVALGRLADAPAWPTTDGGFVSTREIVRGALRAPGVVLIGEARTGPRLDGRPVLVIPPLRSDLLRSVLPPQARLVDCSAYLPARRTADLGLLDLPFASSESLALATGHARALVLPTAAASSHAIFTSGKLIARVLEQPPSPGGAHVIVEDDAAIPEVAPRDEVMALIGAAEWELAWRLCDAVEGDAEAQRALGMASALPSATTRLFLVRCAARLGAYQAAAARGVERKIQPRELLERIRELPLILRVAGGAPPSFVSIHELARRPGTAAIPVLRSPPPGGLAEGVAAVVLPHEGWDGELSRAIPRKLRGGEDLVEEARLAEARRRSRARLPLLPRATLQDLPHDPALPPTRYEAAGVGTIAVAEARPLAPPRLELVHEGALLGTLELHLPLPIHARVEVAAERMLTPELDGIGREWIAPVQALIEEGVAQRVREILRRDREGAELAERCTELIVEWVAAWTDGRTASWQLPREELANARIFRSIRGRRVSARECTEGQRVRYGTIAFTDWLREPGAAREEIDAIHIPSLVGARRWLACLGALADEGTIDVTEEVRAQQRRRRALQHRAASVALPGAAPIPALAARIEQLAPKLGVGEIRLLGESALAGIDLHLFRDGSPDLHTFLAAPVAVAVAVDTPLLPEADYHSRIDTLHAPILEAARALVARVASQSEIPDAAEPALRWYLVSAEAVPDPARQLAVFADTAGKAMSRADLDRQAREYGVVPAVIGAPSEPVELGAVHGRAIVLSPLEIEALRARTRVADVQPLIEDEIRRRSFDRTPPADAIVVRERPKRALRVRFEGPQHGVEGEVALWPPWTAHASWVEWYWQRRPLGTTPFESPWPAQVALEWPSLAPNGKRDGPVLDPSVISGLDKARQMVRTAIDGICAPPPGTTLWVRIPDAVPGTEGIGVGCAWLAASPEDAGRIAADGAHGSTSIETVLRRPDGLLATLPFSARLLLREPPEGTLLDEHVASAIAPIWAVLLDLCVDGAARAAPLRATLLWAHARGLTATARSRAWAAERAGASLEERDTPPAPAAPPVLVATPVIPIAGETGETDPLEARVLALVEGWGIPRVEGLAVDREVRGVEALLARDDHTSRSVLAAFVLGQADRAHTAITPADQLRAMDRILAELSAIG